MDPLIFLLLFAIGVLAIVFFQPPWKIPHAHALHALVRQALRFFTSSALGLTALLHGLFLAGLSIFLAAGIVFFLFFLPIFIEAIVDLRCRQASRRLGVVVCPARDGPDAFTFQPDLSSAHQRIAAQHLLGPFCPLARLLRYF